MDHLALRGPRTDIEEQVLLSNDEGGALKRRLVAAGFAVIDTSPELRDRFAIEAAPMLLVIRPDGRVGYVGGYTRTKQGLQIEDVWNPGELRGRSGRGAARRRMRSERTAPRLLESGVAVVSGHDLNRRSPSPLSRLW